MIVRSIENCLRRVEPQPVEMVLVDPVAGIGDEELAHWARIGTVEIDRLAPVVVVAVSEISRGEQVEIVSVRAEMVVDDVEDDGDPEGMGTVDEAAEIVGLGRKAGSGRRGRRRHSPSRTGRENPPQA